MAEHHQTFKHHRIVVTQETYGEDWYIRVTAPNGCYAYDGWWRNSAGKTAMQALEEAKHGAGLADGVSEARITAGGGLTGDDHNGEKAARREQLRKDIQADAFADRDGVARLDPKGCDSTPESTGGSNAG